MAPTPILICYDGSAASDRAIETASELFPHAQAVVLDVGPLLTPAESIAATASVVPGTAFEDLNTAGALERAQAGAERARAAGLDAKPRASLASPTWEGIVEVADELDSPVIVIGTRALKGARDVLEGSVSHQVAQHAGRPVLIVPAERVRP
jgi:nucleotide-binding universal stress UspA family protein